MRTFIVAVFAVAFMIVAAGCGTTKQKNNMGEPPPKPPESVSGGEIAAGTGAISDEVKKAVSEQMGGCPIADLNIICTEKDRSGECIAVRALGCDKEIEYKFGTN